MGASNIYTAATAQLAEEILFICYRARRGAGETCYGLVGDFGYKVIRFEERYQAEQQALSLCAPCAEERE